MSAKPKPSTTRKNIGRDLVSHEKLPEKTKELMDLEHLNERTTGTEQVEVTKKITDRATKPRT
ncbi:MAG: hypothetical protein V4727_00920 [Verrucomicrobiota bacterium]